MARESEETATPHQSERAVLRLAVLEMGIYVSITLMAALTVAGDQNDSEFDVLAVVWGTALGVALAHWFASGLAGWLTGAGAEHKRVILAHLVAAIGVAGLVTLEVVLLPDSVERSGARFLTAACIGLISLGYSRALGASWARAIRVAAVALVLASLVAGIKYALGH